MQCKSLQYALSTKKRGSVGEKGPKVTQTRGFFYSNNLISDSERYVSSCTNSSNLDNPSMETKATLDLPNPSDENRVSPASESDVEPDGGTLFQSKI